jgi:outer membrane cobalamin receptor
MSGIFRQTRIFLFFVIASSSGLIAEIHPDSIYELPPVIVVGKAILDENIVEKNAATVTRVSEQQIRDLNALDLPSAMRRVPGVLISRHNLVGSYGGGEGGAVYIRGMGAARPGASVQMMVDGVPKFSGIWSHPLMDVMSVDHLEHIDIYKSPRPVRWGNMSFGAVNIISRRMREEGTKTDFTAMYGENESFSTVLNHGGRVKDFDYYLGVSSKGTGGHRVQADGQMRQYWGRVGSRLNDTWDASLIFHDSNNWSRDPGPVNGLVPKRARFRTEDLLLDLTLTNRSEMLNGFVKLYSDDGRINWEQWDEDNDTWFDSNTDYLNRGVRVRQNILIQQNTELTLGFDYDSYGGEFVELHPDPMDTRTMTDKYFSSTAPYVSISHSFVLGRGLELRPSAGVRLNYHNTFGNETAPEAGVVLASDKWNLFANFARGFNYSGVYSVWFYKNAWNYQDDAYTELEPERVKHFEVGLQARPHPKVTVDFCIFHDRGENLLRAVWPPPPPPSFANVGEFKKTGVEASVNLVPSRRVALFAGLTLISTEPEDFPQAPDYMFSLGVNFNIVSDLQLNLDFQAVGERYVENPRMGSVFGKVDSYAVANAKLSYILRSLSGLSGRTKVFLSVENLTDADYEYKPGYPMPGATTFLGLSLDY